MGEGDPTSQLIVGRNRLGDEKSPYLLQHKDNPVWWYPWGDAAFEAARLEDKPIFLSIGYSTCYWCHVMEQDSFETEDVAEVLNEHFICIKLDREERPDIDAIYMDAVVGMTGHGGWPMSMFLTADAEPFYGGTFFYRAHFITVLQRLAEAWRHEREKVLTSGKKIADVLRERREVPIESDAGQVDHSLFQNAVSQCVERFDAEFGGFGGAPKFPPTGVIALLLRIDEPQAREMALQTLEAMARGGIYDQIGGGFSRYSVDAQWLVPHFEKMLYDNALLAVNYFDAFRVSGREAFCDVGCETLDYVLREMTSPEGGFYSAQDAGEVGKEGEYYVWAHRDVRGLLTDNEFEHAESAYGLTPEGNFEAKYTVLSLQREVPFADRSHPVLVQAREKLFAVRRKRTAPHLDDKILTAWNGLMISAFATGFQITRRASYADAAERAALFIQQRLWKDGMLLRRYRSGDARFDGYLEDYAYLIQGLLDLYQTRFDARWLQWADELQQAQDRLLWEEPGGGYVFSASPGILVRRKEYLDGATPSPMAVSFQNLLRLDQYLNREGYRAHAEWLRSAFLGIGRRHPTSVARALIALKYQQGTHQELVVAIPPDSDVESTLIPHIQRSGLSPLALGVTDGDVGSAGPVALLAGRGTLNGEITYYYCENRTCLAPLTGEDEVLRLIRLPRNGE